MKRFLQVLSLGAAALLFAATAPGIAAADNGGRHYGGYEKPYKPNYKPYDGYKNYGHYRRDQNRRYWDNNRPYRDERRFRRDKHRRYGDERRFRRDKHRRYGRDHRRHRHEYYERRHRHSGHRHRRHRHGSRTYFGLYFYPWYGPAYRSEVAPPAYPVQPQATYVQPAVVDQQPQDSPAPSTCLMTREYQTEIVVGGEVVPAYGEACLQPDGSWYRGPAVAERY
jgi:hypothetical protein